jgi:hypothetical protein
MPNQMIALQASGGRVADPARITAQYANMMTAKRQAEAAQSQSALAQQQMEFARAGETRAQETQLTAQQKAKFEYTKGLFEEYTKRLAKIGSTDKTRYSNLRQQIIRDIPDLENELPTPDEWNDNSKFLVLADAEKFLRYKYATPVASVAINDRTGAMTSITAGGPDPRAEVIGEVAPQTATPTAAAPTMASAEAPTAAPESNPFAPDAPPANTAAENVNSLGLVVASARETGVIAQRDVAKLLSVAAPGSGPKLMAWLKQNNIQVAPDAPGVTDNQMRGAPADLPNQMTTTPMAYDGQTPQSQYADLRGPAPQSQTAGLRGAPPMEQTMLQSQGRTPFIARRESPAPAETPQQAGARALAARPSKQEVFDTELARARAARIAANEAGPKPLTTVQEAKLRQNIAKDYKTASDTIATMLHPETGVIAAVQRVRNLTPSQKEWLTGYSTYAPSLTNAGKQADTRFGNLTGKVTAMGRALASLSGSIGPMAVQEWDIVRKQIAEIDPVKLSPQALDEELDLIEAQARGAAARIRDAYENQYIEEFARYPGRFQLKEPGGTPVTKAPKAETSIPRIRGNADFNRLKPGAEFIDPNGVRRRKPK